MFAAPVELACASPTSKLRPHSGCHRIVDGSHRAVAAVMAVGPESASPLSPRRAALHQIIFEADTPGGRAFDIALTMLILLSIVVVSVETLSALTPLVRRSLFVTEWVLTGLFTVEYILRLIAVRRPMQYARSFFGFVDLLAILPTWLSIFIPGAQALLVVRVLRLLRIFRVLKLVHFLDEAQTLGLALRASVRKILVFLLTVAALIVIVGSVMYVVEGPEHGFSSIPTSMYWAVVTLTTVGYGDIAPRTPLGQMLASLVMILGYGIIAVPTGIVTSELARGNPSPRVSTQACPVCGTGAHDIDAVYCRRCGALM